MSITFDATTDYILEDDRVLLRPLTTNDLDYLLPFSLNEPDNWSYSYLTAAGEENMRKYISDALANRAIGKEYAFIVFDKQTGECAGSTRFYDINPNWQTLQLGNTWYGAKFRGTGLNKHCKYLLLQLAFEQWGFVRVEFKADARNARSIAAMKSIGCVAEGVMRSNMPLWGGGRRDSVVLSILKEEWENGVKERLEARL